MEVVGGGWKNPVFNKYYTDSAASRFLRSCGDSSVRLLQCTMPRVDSQRAMLDKSIKCLTQLVITPNSVPDFTIPRSYNSGTISPSRNASSELLFTGEAEDDLPKEAPGSQNDIQAFNTSPVSMVRMRRTRTTPKTNNVRPYSSRSEPASPVHRTASSAAIFRRSHTISYEMIDERNEATTNADPRSVAAMTLPHLKTKTKFGFETLSECPTTQRKESLFHDQNSSIAKANRAVKMNGLQGKRCSSKDILSSSPETSVEHQRRTSSRRRNVSSQVAPLGVFISPHDSMDSNLCSTGSSSPIRSRGGSFEQSFQNTNEDNNSSVPSVAEKRRRFCRSRPVTISQGDLMHDSGILEPEEKAAAARRRSSSYNISLNEEDVQQLWRVSALTSTMGVCRSYPDSSSLPDSDSTLASPVLSSWAHGKGKLKLSLEYMADKNQLNVHIQEAISLSSGQGGSGTDTVNAFVKLSLYPLANSTRHTSSVVKQTNDPVFDQVFAFGDLTQEQLSTQKLRIKVLNREGILRRSEPIGELEVNLAELDFSQQDRYDLQRELETEEIPRELGRLQVKIRFRPNCETLDVTLLNLKDLPRRSITGAPDPYVVLELRQPGRPDIRHQSKVKKKVTSTTINETFELRISPRVEDLTYTCLSLTVYDREMIRSDRVIGEGRLGFGATEKSEFDHWNQVLCNPGREISSWHMLMEEQ